MNDYIIEAASAADETAILNLLTETKLPHEGVSEHLNDFLVARDEAGQIVACAGIEHYGKIGLLRSVAVAPALQASGCGSRLVAAVLLQAKSKGIKEIVLLTTTAKKFFARRFHFVEAARKDYDEALRDSPEWTLPRCSSAAVMKLDLES